MATEGIRYLRREQVDTDRWDRCIDQSANGLVYAYTVYLDTLSKHWDALVWNDYEAVMPLTWNRKWGIYYLYQPPFTASLGVFGKTVTAGLTDAFMQAIPGKFMLIEISLNHGNLFRLESLSGTGAVIIRNNYVLDLKKEYAELAAGYRDNIRRNIKKARQTGYRYVAGIPVEEVISLAKWQMQQVSGYSDADYRQFGSLYGELAGKGQALACGVYTAAGELVASCVYFFSHRRAYYILVGNHPNGRTGGASHFLIDRFIHDHAGQDLLLDFEGSDLRNLAFFYSSFGASLETYPALRVNRLPWWVRLFKR